LALEFDLRQSFKTFEFSKIGFVLQSAWGGRRPTTDYRYLPIGIVNRSTAVSDIQQGKSLRIPIFGIGNLDFDSASLQAFAHAKRRPRGGVLRASAIYSS
jgi:hypothetical protein